MSVRSPLHGRASELCLRPVAREDPLVQHGRDRPLEGTVSIASKPTFSVATDLRELMREAILAVMTEVEKAHLKVDRDRVVHEAVTVFAAHYLTQVNSLRDRIMRMQELTRNSTVGGKTVRVLDEHRITQSLYQLALQAFEDLDADALIAVNGRTILTPDGRLRAVTAPRIQWRVAYPESGMPDPQELAAGPAV